MRITLNMMIMLLTHDKEVIKKASYNKKTYHLPHLFCCEAANRTPPWRSCDLEIATPKKNAPGWAGAQSAATMIFEEDKHIIVADRVGRGGVCILWDMVEQFSRDIGVLGRWIADGVVPDLVVADGGAHYHDGKSLHDGNRQTGYLNPDPGSPVYAESMMSFRTDLEKWLASAAASLATLPESSPLALVMVSSPFSYFSEWPSSLSAYEDMREAVAALPPAARRRTSYLDLHSLWAVDKCGFSTKFPTRSYFWFDAQHIMNTTDGCGHHMYSADPHLMGGAYLHSSELYLELLRLQVKSGSRRCDPGKHVSSTTRVDDLALAGSKKKMVYVH